MIHHRWMVPWWVWYRFGACVRLFGRWYGYNKNIKNTLRHKQVTLYFKKLKRPEKKLSNSTQFQLISLQMFVGIKTKPVIWPACYYQHSCFSGLNKSPGIRLFFKELNTIQSPHQNQPSTFLIHFLHNFTGLVKMTSVRLICKWEKQKIWLNILLWSWLLTYYLLTESEIITGKSQTEALMYWPSESEVNTSRTFSEISL